MDPFQLKKVKPSGKNRRFMNGVILEKNLAYIYAIFSIDI